MNWLKINWNLAIKNNLETTTNYELKTLSDNNQLRSFEVQEFIGNQPNFIIRWGISIFSVILLCIGLISWFIQYPDLVPAKATLRSLNAPKEILTHTDGKLIKITVKDNDAVEAGKALAFMESLANPDAIQQMIRQVDSINSLIRSNQTDEIVNFFPNYENQILLNQLGEVQANYQIFIQEFIRFKDYLGKGFYLRKKEMLFTDLQNIQKLNTILITQKKLLERDIRLTNETFKAQESLAKDKVISSMDYRNEESKLIAKNLSLPQVNSAIISNES